MSAHPTEWNLRRWRAGELTGALAHEHEAHVATCTECQQVLRGFDEEQARFEAQVPYERFAEGVEEARRETARPRTQGMLIAVAATVLLAVLVRPLLDGDASPVNRLKGAGVSVDLRIGGGGAQRAVMPGETETLLPDERVRIGYTAGPYPYLLVVSLDDAGGFSTLYADEDQRSLRADSKEGRHWLPDSVSFSGAGQERVMVLLSREPLEVKAVEREALRAWEEAGHQVAAMRPLGLEGEEAAWVLTKP